MTEQEILEALEEWQSLSVDPENRYAYEMRLKWLLDQLSNIRSSREEGWQEGVKRGIERRAEKRKRRRNQRNDPKNERKKE